MGVRDLHKKLVITFLLLLCQYAAPPGSLRHNVSFLQLIRCRFP
jgi:hypothetical protein